MTFEDIEPELEVAFSTIECAISEALENEDPSALDAEVENGMKDILGLVSRVKAYIKDVQ